VCFRSCRPGGCRAPADHHDNNNGRALSSYNWLVGSIRRTARPHTRPCHSHLRTLPYVRYPTSFRGMLTDRVVELQSDLTFILVSTPHSPLAVHSHKLLILAPVIEGSLGGWSTLTGANTAYIADCTSPGSRSTIFARFTGVLFIGLALGPIIGAWLIRNPIPFLRVGDSTSDFYLIDRTLNRTESRSSAAKRHISFLGSNCFLLCEFVVSAVCAPRVASPFSPSIE
jgi:MFS family permease